MQNSYWHEIYAGRRDWAFDAHEKFLVELDPGLRDNGARGKHVTVVVYGTTQVGKTTLILHLLGVAEAHIERVSNLLRGGAEPGHSATATPLRYRRSKDTFWRIGGPHACGLDDDAARAHFESMRQKVESGHGQATEETRDVVDVYLPSVCFDDAGVESDDVDLRLIDLPGLDAENAHEREHVLALASRLVPYADLIILAGVVDGLGFLTPGSLVLDELKDWQATPYRFRIVCTRVFTRTDDWLLHPGTAMSVDTARDYLMEQLGTHDFKVPREMRSRLYGLEIGQSWREMATNNSILYACAKPLADAFMVELRASIRLAANPWFRLKSAYELPATLERKYRTDRRDRLEKICDLRGEVDCVRRQLDKTLAYVKNFEEDRERLDKRRGYIEAIVKKKQFSAIIERACAKTDFPLGQEKKKSVQEMLRLVDEAIGQLEKFQQNLSVKLSMAQKMLAGDADLPHLGPIAAADAFISLRSKLDSYWFDDYFRESSWDQDMALLRASYSGARDNFAKSFNEMIEQHLEHLRLQLAGQIEKHERVLRALQGRVRKRKNVLKESEIDRDFAHQKWCEYRGRIKRKIAYGQQFMERMREAFEAEQARRGEAMCNERNPAKRFQQHLMLPFLGREYAGMRKGLDQ